MAKIYKDFLSELKTELSGLKRHIETIENRIAEYEQYIDCEDITSYESECESANLKLAKEYFSAAEVIGVADAGMSERGFANEEMEEIVEKVTEKSEDEGNKEKDETIIENGIRETANEEMEETVEMETEKSEDEGYKEEAKDGNSIRVETEHKSVQVNDVYLIKEDKPVIDAYAEHQAWRKDRPGTKVEDMRMAVSLNDKILFINELFNEDADSFNKAVSVINNMESLEDVIDMVNKEHEDWDMESEVVYRFMMAARRRVN